MTRSNPFVAQPFDAAPNRERQRQDGGRLHTATTSQKASNRHNTRLGIKNSRTTLSTPRLESASNKPENARTIREIHNYFSGSDSKCQDIHGATLNASAENPTGLSWVLLFACANTRWIEDGFIFARSSLDLLPAIILPHEIEPVTTGAVVKKQLNDLNKGGEAMSPTKSEATNEDHGQSPSEQPQKLAATKPLLIQPNEGVPVAHQPIAVFSQSIGPATRSFKFLGWYKIDRLQVFEPGSNDLSDMLTKR